MAKDDCNRTGLLILLGIGVGAVVGASVGLLLGRYAKGQEGTEMAESVQDLKDRAQQVLTELAQNVAELTDNIHTTDHPEPAAANG